MHISPQFHVIFDDHFMTAGNRTTDLSEDFYTNLTSKAKWINNDKYAGVEALYHFDAFWSDLPLSTIIEKRGRKHKNIAHKVDTESTRKPSILPEHDVI